MVPKVLRVIDHQGSYESYETLLPKCMCKYIIHKVLGGSVDLSLRTSERIQR